MARLVVGHRPDNPLAIPLFAVTVQAAIDLLPPWAQAMHGLTPPRAALNPLIRASTLGLARTLRWAFAA